MFGGFYQGPYFGNVYQLMPSGNGWTGMSIYLFPNQGTDARDPYGGLTFDKDGNLWGATYDGGDNNEGAIFEMTYKVGSGWQEMVVHSFVRDTDGALPLAALIADASGNFYRTTTQFGSQLGGFLNDVWVLTHANGMGGTPVWTQIAEFPVVSAGSRVQHSAIYDASRNLMVVFGGEVGGPTNDVFLLNHPNRQ